MGEDAEQAWDEFKSWSVWIKSLGFFPTTVLTFSLPLFNFNFSSNLGFNFFLLFSISSVSDFIRLFTLVRILLLLFILFFILSLRTISSLLSVSKFLCLFPLLLP